MVPFDYFSRNGEILPIEAAVMPLDDVGYAYGFGVYETIRLAGGTAYFLDKHIQRLLSSAAIIELPHAFTASFVAKSIDALVNKLAVTTCNLKILLIGGPTAEAASLHILCLNPLFPDRKLYKTGAASITYRYEREFPHAKSLNMLPSYLAYQKARTADAYDALLINRAGNVTEGTRTNFLALKDRTLFSPPEAEILLGVTREAVLQAARQNNFELICQDMPLDSLDRYDSCFLTSTSSKIMPLCRVDDQTFGPPSETLQELMQAFDRLLHYNQ